MPGYWWECDSCHTHRNFIEEVSRGPVVFICDDLSVDWDQRKLVRPCACGQGSLRITFYFPRRKDKDTLTVAHIVGLRPEDSNGFLPMMWETTPASGPETRWFHFNYIYRRGVWGLNRASILERENLQALFHLYFEKTGQEVLSMNPAIHLPKIES